MEIYSDKPNKLVMGLDSYATEIELNSPGKFAEISLNPSSFTNAEGNPLQGWGGIKELRFSEAETLRPVRGSKVEPKKIGDKWKGEAPKFRNLRWENN